jgi:transposase
MIMTKLVTAVESIGGKVFYLPPYLPDFNSIKVVFSVLKF